MAWTEPEWDQDEPIEDEWWDQIEAQDRRAEDGMYDDDSR